jgi:transposase-like protein
MKYTIKNFNADFKTDADCLAFVFKMRYPDGATCKCGKKDCFYPIKKRKCYCCSHCGYQISPTAGTIFHKSETPLKSWLFAMFLISNSKNGVSAMELMRQIGVTYKTAWRMAHQIRKLMQASGGMMSGVVEADETYIGGIRPGKRGRGAAGKTPIIGVLQRGGKIQAKVAADVKTQTVLPNILANVEKGATVCTDELWSYNPLAKAGYDHQRVGHGARQYVRGNVHTNSIEGFWSQLKRSINGTFHHVSPQHLQRYVNEFVYRYNLRGSEQPVFLHTVPKVAEMHA